MKKLISVLLVIVLCLGMFTMAASAATNPFKDVPSGQWYHDDVIAAYNMELIDGKGSGTYKPDDNLTYGEAVKLAACMHQRYTTGAVTLKNGNPWYQSYVDYCKNAGIISKNYSWNTAATRAGYIEIFANALPNSALAVMNSITDGSIPDVPMSHAQSAAIYKLYRAGVVQGTGSKHYCNPSANIKRSEVASILVRMMDSGERVEFSMGTPTALAISQQPQSVTATVGKTVSFSVKATGGTAPYSYKWEASATGYEWSSVSKGYQDVLYLTLREADLRDGLQVRCTVTDAAGKKVVSNAAKINPATSPLQILSQPRSTIADEGDSVSMSVTVTGGKKPYGFVWIDAAGENIYNLGGADITSYAETSVISFKASQYGWSGNSSIRCLITDADGNSVTTKAAYVQVNEKNYDITDATAYASGSNVVYVGTASTLNVSVEGGSGSYSYQWYCNGTAVRDGQTFSGANSKTLKFYTGDDMYGYYNFYCVVVDRNGYNNMVETNTVSITVLNYESEPDFDPYFEDIDFSNPY